MVQEFGLVCQRGGGYLIEALVTMSLRFGSLLKPTIGFCIQLTFVEFK